MRCFDKFTRSYLSLIYTLSNILLLILMLYIYIYKQKELNNSLKNKYKTNLFLELTIELLILEIDLYFGLYLCVKRLLIFFCLTIYFLHILYRYIRILKKQRFGFSNVVVFFKILIYIILNINYIYIYIL